MSEYEYGVMFLPPHVNAYETLAADDLATAEYISGGSGVIVRRMVEHWNHYVRCTSGACMENSEFLLHFEIDFKTRQEPYSFPYCFRHIGEYEKKFIGLRDVVNVRITNRPL